MAVSVKAYLKSVRDGQEIRRFSIPQEASTSFEYLAGKIRQVYPSLLRKEFKLYWKDNDGEYVVFSTDEELLMALQTSISQDHFKVYIDELGKHENGNPKMDTKTKHPGVICDVCDKEVEGTRFKCLTCRDYDLCSECENKGFHPEHQMLRIRTPGSHPMMGFWHFMFGPGFRGQQSGSGWRPRYHGPHSSRRGPHCSNSTPHGPFDGTRHCRRGGPGFSGPWGCHGWQGERNGSNNTTNDKKDTQQDGTPSYPTFKEIFDNISEVVGESLRAAGQYPWEFEPQNEGQSQSEGKANNENCPTNNKEDQARNDAGKSSDTQSKDQDADSDMPQNESFVVVNKSTVEQKEEQPAENLSNQIEQRRRQEEEFEKKLGEAIKQMENMGFNNESGWLSQLLIAKDFDIARVIDTLEATK